MPWRLVPSHKSMSQVPTRFQHKAASSYYKSLSLVGVFSLSTYDRKALAIVRLSWSLSRSRALLRSVAFSASVLGRSSPCSGSRAIWLLRPVVGLLPPAWAFSAQSVDIFLGQRGLLLYPQGGHFLCLLSLGVLFQSSRSFLVG